MVPHKPLFNGSFKSGSFKSGLALLVGAGSLAWCALSPISKAQAQTYPT